MGRLAPDARIIGEDIAERFGVSRSPVRESIGLLERAGLIIRAERRGSRVSPVSRRDLAEVHARRVALEELAASEGRRARCRSQPARAAGRGGPAAGRLGGRGDAACFRANGEFTEAVHRAADNATLRCRFLACRATPELMSASLEGNRGLVDAIRRRDKDAARLRTERLIKESWRTVRKCLPEGRRRPAQGRRA